MERRKTPRKDWIITKDDVGRAVLEWQPDPLRAKRMAADPCARTFDFLARLDVPDLAIEDDVAPRASPQSQSFDPYDHSAPSARKQRSGS